LSDNTIGDLLLSAFIRLMME